MRKYSAFIVFILLGFQLKEQSNFSIDNNNTITCIYQATYKPDSLSDSKKTEVMLLRISPTLSKFESLYSYRADSIVASPTFDQSSVNLLGTYLKTGFTYEIYKPNTSKEVKYYDKIGRKIYEVEQNNNTIKWQITNITKPVTGYTCRKATTTFAGRQWEAWFTTEVPLSEGPYKFKGLPGLITQIQDSQDNYHFSLLKVSKTPPLPAVSLPTNAIKTSESIFKKAKQDYLLQGVSKVIKNNSNGSQAEEQKQLEAYKQKVAHRNNPIELK